MKTFFNVPVIALSGREGSVQFPNEHVKRKNNTNFANMADNITLSQSSFATTWKRQLESDNLEATTRKRRLGSDKLEATTRKRQLGSDNLEATTRKRQLGSDNSEATTGTTTWKRQLGKIYYGGGGGG